MIFPLFAHPLENFFFRNTDCLVLNTWEKNWGIICCIQLRNYGTVFFHIERLT